MSKLIKIMFGSPIGGGVYIQTIGRLFFCLLITIMLSGVMMSVYKICHDSLTYNRNFNITLIMLSICATVLLAIVQNNPAFSLGALGALSICRIRTNTKDPRDLGFVFWSMAIGISCAIGAYAVGVLSTIFMSVVMLTIGRPKKKKDVVTMIVRGTKDRIEEAQSVFSNTPGSVIQSKNVFENSFELVYDLKIPQEEEKRILLKFNNMKGISGVNVLAPETKVA